MTFQRAAGRPSRTTTFRELVLSPDRIDQRIQVVNTAYREAIAGGSSGQRWAQWLAQVSGEWSSVQVNVLTDSPMLSAINGMRDALGLPALGAPQAIDAQSTLVPDDPPTDAT